MPGTLSARAFAKVNLELRIRGRLPDGYHRVDTVLQKLSPLLGELYAQDRARSVPLENSSATRR